jgi:3-dehydroquinate synthase
MHNVRVELGSRSYDIVIDNGLLAQAGPALSARSLLPGHAAIITNTTVAPLYLDGLTASLHSCGFSTEAIILPDGEQYKTLDTMRTLYDRLLGLGLDRRSTLIALGGGVIGDMTGFAAATFLRGIPFVQVPTTLLAQVDSSVGGKTGVNLAGGKNMVGAFYQPAAVLIDPLVLKTLPERELRTGLAEIIKYGIINDAEFFCWLESGISALLRLDSEEVAACIRRCCMIKAAITSRDETEQGVRAHLNYGHTLGHALETLTGYARFLHGEAVAIGMCAAAHLAHYRGLCAVPDVQRIEALIKAAGLPVTAPALPVDQYINAMLKDKKKTGETVNFVLPQRIGEVALHPVTEQQLREWLPDFVSPC